MRLRDLFQRLGLIPDKSMVESKIKAAHVASKAAREEVKKAQRRRGLAIEIQSYRPPERKRH